MVVFVGAAREGMKVNENPHTIRCTARDHRHNF